jgi:hypothetical protein
MTSRLSSVSASELLQRHKAGDEAIGAIDLAGAVFATAASVDAADSSGAFGQLLERISESYTDVDSLFASLPDETLNTASLAQLTAELNLALASSQITESLAKQLTETFKRIARKLNQ